MVGSSSVSGAVRDRDELPPEEPESGWTTSKNVAYRLLLEGLALWLRQVWVNLTQQIAQARGFKPNDWVDELPMVEMLLWLADHLRAKYLHDLRIDLTPPILTDTATP